MTADAQSLTDQIRQMAQAKGMEPLDLLRELVERETRRDQQQRRSATHNHNLRLVKA